MTSSDERLRIVRSTFAELRGELHKLPASPDNRAIDSALNLGEVILATLIEVGCDIRRVADALERP